MTTKRHWYMLLSAVFMTGCAETNRPDSHPQVGQGLARIDTDVDVATANVEAAKPHANTVGQVRLDVATVALKDAKVETAKTMQSQEQAAKAYNQTVAERDEARHALKAEQDRFFSKVQRRIAWWAVGVGFGLVLLLGVLKGLAASYPVVGLAYKGLLAVSTGGASVVRDLIAKLFGGR